MQIVESYKAKIINVNSCLKDTIDIYRAAVSYLVDVINIEWVSFIELTANYRINLTEKLVHKTKDNPYPSYVFDTVLPKFPSYLRRSAISDAMGIVSSYRSNLSNYNLERYTAISSGKKFQKLPPTLKLKHFKCPALYSGNMFNIIDRTHAEIKIHKNNDWVWLTVALREQDIKYMEKNCSGKKFSPILLKKDNNYYLQFSFQYETILRNTKLKDKIIVSVDLGINHSAVCSAMNPDGTVIGRKFINQPVEKDRMNHSINRLCLKQYQSGHGAKLVKPWAHINNLKDEITNKTVNAIIDFAIECKADIIVFEYLGKFSKIKGKKNKQIRMRLQLWTKISVQNKVEHKAHSKGIRVTKVSARNTSALAFDGSGKVHRDNKNASLCTFTTGKQYNCDLNASYNIGSRYCIREILQTMSEKTRSEVVAKVPQLLRRTQCTLSTLVAMVSIIV
jgi:IS605 OrfB family transposase